MNFPSARCCVDGRGAGAHPCPELGLGPAASPKHLHCLGMQGGVLCHLQHSSVQEHSSCLALCGGEWRV